MATDWYVERNREWNDWEVFTPEGYLHSCWDTKTEAIDACFKARQKTNYWGPGSDVAADEDLPRIAEHRIPDRANKPRPFVRKHN